MPHTSEPSFWVQKHAAYLVAYAHRKVRDREHANDLVQDTFLSALSGLENFEGRCSERTWLISILRNKIIDDFRRRKKYTITSLESAELFKAPLLTEEGRWKNNEAFNQVVCIDPDPFALKELNQVICNWMGNIPQRWSTVFEKKCLNDEKPNAICDELKLSKANYWVVVHRTRTDLKAFLDKNW